MPRHIHTVRHRLRLRADALGPLLAGTRAPRAPGRAHGAPWPSRGPHGLREDGLELVQFADELLDEVVLGLQQLLQLVDLLLLRHQLALQLLYAAHGSGRAGEGRRGRGGAGGGEGVEFEGGGGGRRITVCGGSSWGRVYVGGNGVRAFVRRRRGCVCVCVYVSGEVISCVCGGEDDGGGGCHM